MGTYTIKGEDLDVQRVVVNGREYDVDPDTNTLLDRRQTPQDGIRLNADERRQLQLRRLCEKYLTTSERLVREGYLDAQGRLTSSGRLLADVLLADTND